MDKVIDEVDGTNDKGEVEMMLNCFKGLFTFCKIQKEEKDSQSEHLSRVEFLDDEDDLDSFNSLENHQSYVPRKLTNQFPSEIEGG